MGSRWCDGFNLQSFYTTDGIFAFCIICIILIWATGLLVQASVSQMGDNIPLNILQSVVCLKTSLCKVLKSVSSLSGDQFHSWHDIPYAPREHTWPIPLIPFLYKSNFVYQLCSLNRKNGIPALSFQRLTSVSWCKVQLVLDVALAAV